MSAIGRKQTLVGRNDQCPGEERSIDRERSAGRNGSYCGEEGGGRRLIERKGAFVVPGGFSQNGCNLKAQIVTTARYYRI